MVQCGVLGCKIRPERKTPNITFHLWHVRTKENIARVRKDEAEAAEKQRQEKLRIETADREARLNVLKSNSKQRLQDAGIEEPEPRQDIAEAGHINLFADLDHAIQSTNKEHDKETKEEKEKYEKKIGYLTYLGQDTNEAFKKKNWYEVAPEERVSRSETIKDTYEKLVLKDADGKPKSKEIDEKDGEIAWKAKQFLDPFNNFKQYCPPKIELSKDIKKRPSVEKKHDSSLDSSSSDEKHKRKSKDKKHKKKKDDRAEKMLKLQNMREARLKRELQEKQKTNQFLIGLHKPLIDTIEEQPVDGIKRKYHSQFNPSIARQNYRSNNIV